MTAAKIGLRSWRTVYRVRSKAWRWRSQSSLVMALRWPDTSVWRLTDGRLAWEFRTHHILLDAYAISLLTRRVAQVYTALARGESVPESTFGTVAEMIAAEDDYDSSDVAERDRTLLA